ncbi:MAG: MFS transporter [Anaerolineales bacterium]|nr:MFS transporter [Anaerolineales bacterium]
MDNHSQPAGMKAFGVIWFGQLISMLGTGMTNFALSFWIFEQTGRATALTWAMVFFFAPMVLASPVAGALVDRSNRKLVMVLSDLAAGVVTIVLLLLLTADNLQLWHIYAGNFIAGLFNSLQFPAYSAAVTLMLPKKHYGRASGMIALAGSASQILAPVAAGALLAPLGLRGIMALDVVTFVAAIATLLVVAIPQPAASAAGRAGQGSLWQESLYGFRYIFRRKSLLGLQLVFLGINFTSMFGMAVLVPMILARTGNDELTLGSVQSIGAVGGVVGGLLLSAWGGPRRKVYGVLGGMLLVSIFGQGLMGLGRGLLVWAAAGFMIQLIIPILNGSNQAIWQAKVAPDVQGRVFSVRRLIAQVTAPVATAVAGPLADNLFEPALRADGALAGSFGWLVGTGPGAGMSLMLVITGLLGVGVAVAGFLVPVVRNAEDLLPDYDAVPPEQLNQERLTDLLAERGRWQRARHSDRREAEIRRISQALRQLGQPAGET